MILCSNTARGLLLRKKEVQHNHKVKMKARSRPRPVVSENPDVQDFSNA
jgi:hypothetical protein